jgi:hypothetical protein
MDLSRAVYSRDLKIAAMRALDAGCATAEIARKHQKSITYGMPRRAVQAAFRGRTSLSILGRISWSAISRS